MRSSRFGRSPVVLLLAAMLVAVGATACDSDTPRSDAVLDYAALGDSFTAAPWLPRSSEDGCARSDQNYPHQVAAQLPDVRLIDVSCGGATTEDIIQSQELANRVHPAQLDALGESTDIVTIGIGGNDLGFSGMIFSECVELAPTAPQGSPCADKNAERTPLLLKRIGRRLTEVLDAISTRAPEARVLVVGYPRLLPDSRGCPQRFPLAEGDVDFVRDSFQGLIHTLRAAAREAGVDYLDVAAASEGHEVCSDDPWINGDSTDRRTKAAPYHPTPAEQAAVAELILALL